MDPGTAHRHSPSPDAAIASRPVVVGPPTIDRREFVQRTGVGAAALTLTNPAAYAQRPARPPNIVFVLADDLGYGDVGPYGQEKIRTPHLDRMAAEGMRFTQHYAGSPVCAPARCVLLTGLHTGHCYIRDNDAMADRGNVWEDMSLEGNRPLLPGTATVASHLREAGYVTGGFGKWGLGGPGSTGEPNRQGFDYWFGYLGQRLAHNHYPVHLWRNTERVALDNDFFVPHQTLDEDADPHDPASYEQFRGREYAPAMIFDEARDFIRRNQDRPFFLYLATTFPHAALQVPEEALDPYRGAFDETPYTGQGSYLPHPMPRAAYAAMVTTMDEQVGRIMELLDELDLDRDTILFFSSDNGPTFTGGVDAEFFESTGPFRGLKEDMYDGAIRVPLIVRWPDRIEPGTVSAHLSAAWDVLPTLVDLAGAAPPEDIDGLSFLPTLEGRPEDQAEHQYLYWEYRGKQAVRLGNWKGVRPAYGKAIELYRITDDLNERRDLAKLYPRLVSRIEEMMETAHAETELYPHRRYRGYCWIPFRC